jgi:hypothetical protein
MDWNMPFPSLFRRLDEKTKGRLLDAEQGRTGEHHDKLLEKERKSYEARSDVQDDWIDYTIDW